MNKKYMTLPLRTKLQQNKTTSYFHSTIPIYLINNLGWKKEDVLEWGILPERQGLTLKKVPKKEKEKVTK